MRSGLLWICVVMLFAIPLTSSRGSPGDRQEAAVGLVPQFERVGGAEPKPEPKPESTTLRSTYWRESSFNRTGPRPSTEP